MEIVKIKLDMGSPCPDPMGACSKSSPSSPLIWSVILGELKRVFILVIRFVGNPKKFMAAMAKSWAILSKALLKSRPIMASEEFVREARARKSMMVLEALMMDEESE